MKWDLKRKKNSIVFNTKLPHCGNFGHEKSYFLTGESQNVRTMPNRFRTRVRAKRSVFLSGVHGLGVPVPDFGALRSRATSNPGTDFDVSRGTVRLAVPSVAPGSVVRPTVFRHAGYDVLPPPHVPGGRRRPVRRAAGQPLADVRVRVDAQWVPAGGPVRRRLPPGLLAAARRRRRGRQLRRLADFARLDRRLFAEHMLDVGRPGPQHRAAVDRVLRRPVLGFLREMVEITISSLSIVRRIGWRGNHGQANA